MANRTTRAVWSCGVGLLLSQILLAGAIWSNLSRTESRIRSEMVTFSKAIHNQPLRGAVPARERLVGKWSHVHEYGDSGNVVMYRALYLHPDHTWTLTARIGENYTDTRGSWFMMGNRIEFSPSLAAGDTAKPNSHTLWHLHDVADQLMKIREHRYGTAASSWGDEETWIRE